MKAFWFAAWVGKKINRKGFEARRDYYGIIKSDRQQYNHHNLYPLSICPIHSNFLTSNTAASKGLHFWKILWWTLIYNINKVKRHKLISRHSEKKHLEKPIFNGSELVLYCIYTFKLENSIEVYLAKSSS